MNRKLNTLVFVAALAAAASAAPAGAQMTPYFQCLNVGKAHCQSTTGGDPEAYMQCLADYAEAHCVGLPGDPGNP